MSHHEEHNKKNLSPEELFRLLEDADMPVSDTELDAFEQEALEGFAELETPAQAQALHAEIQQQIDAHFIESAPALVPENAPASEQKMPVRYFRLVASLVLLFTLGTVLFFWLKPEGISQVADNGRHDTVQHQVPSPSPAVGPPNAAAPITTVSTREVQGATEPTVQGRWMSQDELVVPDAAAGEATADADAAPVEAPALAEKELEATQKEEAAKDFKPMADLSKNEETPAYSLNESAAKLKTNVADTTALGLVAAPSTSGSIQYWNNNVNGAGYTNYSTPQNLVPNATTIERKSLYPSVNSNVQTADQNSYVIISNKKETRRAKTKAMNAGSSAAPSQTTSQASAPAKPAAQGKTDTDKQPRLYDESVAAAGATVSAPVFAADTLTVEAWLQKSIGNDPRFSSAQRVAIRLGIGKDGKVAEVRFVKAYTNCDYCETRLRELLKSMPAWKPASSNGQPVYGTFDLSFRFQQ